jgi:hypothetical protein
MVDTPVGRVEFHVVHADTPFLLCLADMDALQVYYNNLSDTLVTPTGSFSVIRRFGHPFLCWEESLQLLISDSLEWNSCLLSKTELRRLHRRFGHPSAERLYRVLERSGHEDIEKQTLNYLTKFAPASWVIQSGGPMYVSIQHNRSMSHVCLAERLRNHLAA